MPEALVGARLVPPASTEDDRYRTAAGELDGHARAERPGRNVNFLRAEDVANTS
jgi:hypothetical protein